MLQIYHSNCLEPLLGHLATTLDRPLNHPFEPETIVIQNQGMARWLAIELAKKRSLSANIEFPFPASFIWKVFQSQLKETPDTSAFDKEVLAWRIQALLPSLIQKTGFEALSHYLSNKSAPLKTFQLAYNIADVFDQYMVYRPDWIMAWQRGEETHWQAQLWRALTEGQSALHRCELIQNFIVLHEQCKLNPSSLPERITVFGASAMPPAYLDVIARLADVTEVNCYLLNPCLSYWGDIIPERDISRLRALWQKHGKTDASEYYTVGNSLLASLGKSGRDFQELLHQYPSIDNDLFIAPEGNTLLANIQTDILLLSEASKDTAPFSSDDRSLQLHVCHSPMREIEVLHDQLLYCFEQDPTLTPQDIIVMAPDIDVYAPYIEAVFATTNRQQFIPWSIADRSVTQEQPLIQVFLQLIQLPGSRFSATEILSLLETPEISKHFDIDEKSLESIRQWIQESGIRWGESENPNSWHFGMQRMLLGYAMPPEKRLFNNILPFSGIEGTNSAVLGQLQFFISQLSTFKSKLNKTYKPKEWVHLLYQLLDTFFEVDEESNAVLQIIRDTLDQFVQHTEIAQFETPLALPVIQDYLKAHLGNVSQSQRFITGQTTFCTMQPMRSIPFKVVCLLGMNDSDYPRHQRPLGFDLINQSPRKGDRSRREDDRYLFLEALLSARNTFYISYIGRSIHDNSVKIPSVLVSELFEYIETGYTVTTGKISKQLTTEHPLQPFNQRYYQGDSKLFSYNDTWLVDSKSENKPLPFISTPLCEPEESYKTVQLAQLINFFKNPSRFFLKERLGIHLEEYDEALEESEPFDLDPLQRYQLKQTMLQSVLEESGLSDDYAFYNASGILPYGGFGKITYKEQQEAVDHFKDKLLPFIENSKLDDLEIDLKIGGFTLQGWLTSITPKGRTRYRLAKYKADSDHIPLSIEHLVFNALAPDHCEHTSVHIAENKTITLEPIVGSAQAKLEKLLNYYWQGLSMPLKFFPNSAYEYIEMLNKNKPAEEALKKALGIWDGNNKVAGESNNPYHQILYSTSSALDDHFIEISEAVYSLFK